MNQLETIMAYKKRDIVMQKAIVPLKELEKRLHVGRPIYSLNRSLSKAGKTGIIAEFKRRSPSKGIINGTADVAEVTTAYYNYGASGLSILTDSRFFGGSARDLAAARHNPIPILRKDFIIDEYQVLETKRMKADVILLIAACLKPAQVKVLAGLAKSIGLEVLLELHNEAELDHICDEVDMVGVNNRDLRTFTVDIDRSLKLFEKVPKHKPIISESGIDNIETIHQLKQEGFSGFLIGELFMKQNNPGAAFKTFLV